MNKNEEQFNDRVQNAYENEELNIPDIDAAWLQFEPMYFKQKKRRFLLLYVCFAAVTAFLFILNSFPISKLYKLQALHHLTLPHQQDQHSGYQTIGHAGKLTIDSKTGFSLKTTDQFKEKDLPNVKQQEPLTTYKQSLQKQTDAHVIAHLSDEVLAHVESKEIFHILTDNLPSDSAKKDIPSLIPDSAMEPTDSVLNDSTHKKHITQDPIKLNPKNSRFAIHFANQIEPASRSKLFNPEFALQYRRETGKLSFQTGLGIGLKHFNHYGFSQLNVEIDSQGGDFTKDSIVGQMTSSFYFFIPVSVGMPVFRQLKFHLGVDLLLHTGNTFEKTSYTTQNSFIRPSSVDSVITSQTTIEKHNRVSPSLRLTWHLSYSIKQFDLVFGMRKTLYNGFRSLNLPGEIVSRPKLNFALGLVYHF